MGGFVEYYGQSNVHPLGLIAVLAMGLMVVLLPRRYALVPFIIAACTIPMAQRVMIGPADFTFLRLMILLGWTRIILRGESVGLRWHRLDSAVVAWCLAGTVIFTSHHGGLDALVNRLGWTYDIAGTYFLVRCMVRDWSDVTALSRWLAIISVPLAIAFAVEWTTRYNAFSIFGGVRAETWIRHGRLRCQGAFSHPILAGTFWAAALPMIWMLWHEGRRERILCYIGTAGALFIIAACSSTTPILSAAAIAFAAALYRYRKQRRTMWVSLLGFLAALHVLMAQPVWHLMARIDLLGGSTGWHRYIIFDTFVNNISKWYATGESDPMSWGVWQMRDITNQYMIEGLRGGIITLAMFILVLVFAFANIGRLLTVARKVRPAMPELKIWLLGAALFMHTMNFFALSYFGQMTTIWYMQLGIIGSMAVAYTSKPIAVQVSDSVTRKSRPRVAGIVPQSGR